MNPNYKSAEGERAVMALYDKMLAAWPVPYEGLNVETRHGRTFVIASGQASAPALVLLHGTCSNALAWMGDVAEYSRAFRVYAVDVPGEPGRSGPERAAWVGPAYAEWLEDVYAGLRVQKASLVGLSQGAWIALKFATLHPERVDKLALLAPGGIVPARLSFILRAIPLSMMGRRGGEAINRITFGKQPIHPQAVVFMDTIMEHFRARIEPQPFYSDEELRRLTMPVLLMAGAQDALYPSEKTAARLEKLLPRLSAIILPETGHVVHNTAGTIAPFLKGEPARDNVDSLLRNRALTRIEGSV